MSNKIKSLFKENAVTKSTKSDSRKLENTRQQMKKLCEDLTVEAQRYKPEKSVESIRTYISDDNKLELFYYIDRIIIRKGAVKIGVLFLMQKSEVKFNDKQTNRSIPRQRND